MKDDALFTLLEAMVLASNGESPSKAIENQEKRGQADVIRNQRLPKKLSNSYANVDKDKVRAQYESMGIRIIGDYDDLFWTVELPAGWRIQATDHSMWSELRDDKNRKRASFFYKAAFYDRDAFIRFVTRFQVNVDHVADIEESYEVWTDSDYQGTVKDGDEVIYRTKCVPASGSWQGDASIRDLLFAELKNFMLERYPNYEDVNAYWND